MRISDWSSDVCSSDLLCHAVTMIPANPGYSSLNLSQAVQVLAYELRKASLPEVPTVSSKDGHPWYEPPPAEEMERFYTHLQKILLSTGFLDPANPRLLMRRLRQFYNRASPAIGRASCRERGCKYV